MIDTTRASQADFGTYYRYPCPIDAACLDARHRRHAFRNIACEARDGEAVIKHLASIDASIEQLVASPARRNPATHLGNRCSACRPSIASLLTTPASVELLDRRAALLLFRDAHQKSAATRARGSGWDPLWPWGAYESL